MHDTVLAIAFDLTERLPFHLAVAALRERLPRLDLESAEEIVAPLCVLSQGERDSIARELFHAKETP